MRIIAVAFLLSLIAGPVLAQDHIQQYREEEKEKTQAQKAEEQRAQRAYQRSLGNVPDQKQADPWGIARTDSAAKNPPKAEARSEAKSAAKTAAPKHAKPANAAN
ncbi:hypothetical protein CI1B_58720 [Bradyrhizobium ivorense]|uniref:Uncharacterized protein n=1 Tax=Bradyrhizobium ivorense TaxID=2511166 RepID=A0A508TM13_9BRAD|nr:hypothetical protein [Bradyrhizobium ivorense]VIO75368.1 hypothetical protein CI1B_58720 [Bradyrhizobium ivorense]